MKTKLLSVFFIALMISGILAPLLMVNEPIQCREINPTESMEISANTISWHDDCSSASGWYENTTNVENLIDKVQTGIALLTDGNGLYSNSIPSDSYDSHGPQFFKKLATPMVLKDDLSLQVDIEHVGTSGSMGSVGIVLLDQNNDTFYKVGGVDGWVSSECNAWAGYRQDGSNVKMEYDTRSGAWIGTIRIWYDSITDSIITNVTGSEVTLASSGEFIPEREVHFVGIVFYNQQSNTYESHIINDILITSSVSESGISSWYHDCSNTSAFDGVADDTWYGNPDIHIDGSIASMGGYIYADDYGTGSVSYGPMMYHSFSSPFCVSSLDILSAEFEMDASSATSMAAGAVVLFDQNNDTIITINVADSWSGYSVVAAYVSYDFANGTRIVTPYTNPAWTVAMPYREMISVIQNSTGIYASIPRVGYFEIISAGDIETDRNVSSIAVNFRASAMASIGEINRIHEIHLNHLSTADIISIDSPPDIVYAVDTSGHNITWTPQSTIPDLYEIFLDGNSIEVASWDGSPITINVDNLLLGIYNYSIYVNNTAGGSVTDWVLVTVNENGTTGTTETTETTGTEPETGPSDYLVIIISFGSVGVIVIIIGAICRNRGPGSTSVPNPGPTYEW